MVAQVKVRYANGVFTPLEPLDIQEGEELLVSIEAQSSKAAGKTDAPLSANGASADAPPPAERHETILEMFERLRNSVPPEAWDNLPLDGAKNYKHYLYGHPKEED